MEKKLIVINSIIIFGAIETVISLITVAFIIPDMVNLDIRLGTNFFNENLAYVFFSIATILGLVQVVWGIRERKKKKHKISKLLLYKGIIFSIIMLFSLYYFLMFPLEKMVIASY
ncbi:MAG: hypothetical protein ACD_37C00160G0002 [uncultured bacterium]|nr:MAG: hypothetical protein ACD_37C00160G0002 [uncultured bacterium]